MNYLGRPITANAHHGSTYDKVRGVGPDVILARSNQAVFNLAAVMDDTIAAWNDQKIESLTPAELKRRNGADNKFVNFYNIREIVVPAYGKPLDYLLLTQRPLAMLRILRDNHHLFQVLTWEPVRNVLFSPVVDSYAAVAEQNTTSE